jgi:hypothetical protein
MQFSPIEKMARKVGNNSSRLSPAASDESLFSKSTYRPRKEMIYVISDSSEDEEPAPEVEDEEFYSKVVSPMSSNESITLKNFFGNIPSARSSKRFSFLHQPKDEEIPDSGDEQPADATLQEHVVIVEIEDENESEPIVANKSTQIFLTEANTDLRCRCKTSEPKRPTRRNTPAARLKSTFRRKFKSTFSSRTTRRTRSPGALPCQGSASRFRYLRTGKCTFPATIRPPLAGKNRRRRVPSRPPPKRRRRSGKRRLCCSSVFLVYSKFQIKRSHSENLKDYEPASN